MPVVEDLSKATVDDRVRDPADGDGEGAEAVADAAACVKFGGGFEDLEAEAG
jgi:hypothetical protein